MFSTFTLNIGANNKITMDSEAMLENYLFYL